MFKSSPDNPFGPAGAGISDSASSSDPPEVEETVDLSPDIAIQLPELVKPTSEKAPILFGRYEARTVLGSGGYGTVYLGYDPQLTRAVAIKVLKGGARASQSMIDEFLEEARRLAQLHHPGIVAVHDAGVQGGQVYIVSEFLSGSNLGEWLSTNRLTWLEAARIAAGVADALAHAHSRVIVHRDVKPANIIITLDRKAVLVDFGIGLDDTKSDGRERGVVRGTPAYMSPEQVSGEAHRIDGRTDIYSLGVVLYQMLCGRAPFRSRDRVELLRQVLVDEPQPPRQICDIPPELERICLKALAKRMQDRYTTAADFANELRTVCESSAVTEDVGALPAGSKSITSTRPTDTPSAERRAREAERRQVTVLVCGCELFESEPYLGLDEEDQARVLRAFERACGEPVRQFGGTILQCNEKGLLACFGFPVAYEDTAHRAARTGLAILDVMKTLGEQFRREGKLDLNPWVGIHTGPAIVESLAGEVSLVGEARSVAVRLEGVAVVGQMICTEASYRMFQGRFQCATLGRQKVRGVARPVELYRVEGIAVPGSLLEAVAPAELSPLTGRDHEVSLLKDRWDQAQEGMGQVVLLIGEAGLGKSRLVHTLKEHVLGQMVEGEVDSPVIEWRCSPHFQNTSLYPAINFYERALAIDREEPPEDRINRLLHRLEQYHLVRPETAPLWASLLSLPTPERFPPLSLSPVRQREETFRTMLEWLHTRAARKPILFVVEDLHWVDASTLEFLGQFLAEGLHDSILTLLTFRPEFETPWPVVAHQTSLALNRLTRRQVAELMRKKSGSALPEALVEQVYDRTSGVPLFVEEFTKMVQESASPDTEWASASGPIPLGREIPATLQDLMMARLDRMEGEREVAQLAATLGREFSHELLAAAAALEKTTLEAELAKLVQAEILYPKGQPPRRTYIFKHALLEDALYNALVKGKRQQFHRRIAEVLEAQFPQTAETQPELLAHHFSEAGMGEKGAEYWLKAGLQSRERSAEVEAIGHLTKGLALIAGFPESPERDAQELRFLNPLGTAYIAARGYAAPEVGPVFRRAHELCDRLGQPSQQLAIIWGTWVGHLVHGEMALCMDKAAEGMELAARLHDPGIQMEALFMLGGTRFYRADFAIAHKELSKAAQYEDRERTRFWAASTGHDAGVLLRAHLAHVSWHLGYPDRALEINREMVELAQAIGQPLDLANSRYHSLVLHQYCRLGAETEAGADEEIRIASEQGLTFFHATGLLHKAGGALLQGRLEESLTLLGTGLAAYRGTGGGFFLPNYLSILGDAYTQSGQFAKAREALDEGLAIADKNHDRTQEAELHRLQGELHLAETNDQAAAEECFHKAIETARRQQSKAWELRATMSLARLRERQGRPGEARSTLEAIYDTYTEGFTTPDLVDAKSLLDTLR